MEIITEEYRYFSFDELSEDAQEKALIKGGTDMYGDGALYRAMADGIIAQRKLDGDPDAYGPDDVSVLNAIVAQGKRIEEYCRKVGKLATIERATRDASGQPRERPTKS